MDDINIRFSRNEKPLNESEYAMYAKEVDPDALFQTAYDFWDYWVIRWLRQQEVEIYNVDIELRWKNGTRI